MGGLADVEWTVQLLQLLHGHRRPELRTTRTLDALTVAAKAGLIEASDAFALEAGWRQQVAAGLSADAATITETVRKGEGSLGKLVNDDDVFAIFASYGTDENLATRPMLNRLGGVRAVPQV